jgi:DNA-directed RNA polymerase subunit M/transcription elongation factor TFIIS
MKINITRDEFRGFVFNELENYYEEKEIGREYLYKRKIGNNYKLRILSSISTKNEEPIDKDAIRIHIYHPEKGVIRTPSTSHRKRTPNYREKIKEDIEELIECPKCKNSELRINSGEYGDYFFCLDQDCNYTHSTN